MNIAIIVAAGSGQRFGPGSPKQFALLLGKPVIVQTVERFQDCPDIDEIVLVLSDKGSAAFAEFRDQYSLDKLKQVVIGGPTRAQSVKNGLGGVSVSGEDIIIVHDGARPLVTVEEISRTVHKAAKTGAACLVAEINDTIKSVDGAYISRTIDRTKLRRALTPQAFRSDVIRKAFEGVDLSENITDECYLVEKLGYPITLVEGSGRNIKITTPDDLVHAESLLKASDT
jgi:2-C-methyl-D-erythritol 4-phosphate cytidylyltransferase